MREYEDGTTWKYRTFECYGCVTKCTLNAKMDIDETYPNGCPWKCVEEAEWYELTDQSPDVHASAPSDSEGVKGEPVPGRVRFNCHNYEADFPKVTIEFKDNDDYQRFLNWYALGQERPDEDDTLVRGKGSVKDASVTEQEATQ